MPQLAEVQAPHSPGRPRRSPVDPEAFLDLTLMRGNSRVDVKATECHFPLNSTKHMGAGLHLSQIVKIFFFLKKPKSRDGSKCA